VNHVRKRLTYANVMSSIAVFLVLGGATAFAALGKGTVGTRQLKKNAVKVGKIAGEAVKAGKLAKNAVPTNRLRDNAVSATKVAAGSILTDKLAVFAVTADKIGPNAVTTSKIANDAVTTDKIADNAVTTNKIANNAVTGAKVNEATLGTVPSAANAAALGGIAASGYTRRIFARVNYTTETPTLSASSPGIVANGEGGLGFPRLIFPQSMTNCAVVASASSGAGTQIVRRSAGGGSTVQFAIKDDEGNAVRADFDVIAVC
jgi:hypothetical protein